MYLRLALTLAFFAIVQVRGQHEAFRFGLSEAADVECPSREYEEGAIWIRLAVNYTEACYNIADLFQEDFGYGTDNQSTCLFHTGDCDRQWEARLPENYNSTGNFSYASWQVTTNPGEWAGFPNYDPADVTLRVFREEDCRETEEKPLYQWGGCVEPANDCVQLPYGVKSFRAMRTTEEDKSDGCLVAAEQGAGHREFSVQLVWSSALAVGVVVLALIY